ncbi:MAG: SDR family oxidoreductase [Thermoplasmata archaeon]|nr:MAG: SDR family oxidoreductase [Thermoplasmata archaeon]
MAKILITGGAGFIGSHLADGLAQMNHDIIVLDNLDPYYDREIKNKNMDIVSAHPNCSFIHGDILDFALLENIVKNDIEFIFHEAAQPGVRTSVENPLKPNDVNVKGTLAVLEAARKGNVKRVVNASSSSVYGKVEYLPFDEGHPTQPLSPYGVSKLVAEHYCRVYHEIYGLPTLSLRYFTVYGPRMRPDLAIPIFTRALLSGKPPEIFGDGEQTRDLTFIDDIISANLKLLETDSADGTVLNIGAGHRFSVNQLYDNLQRLVGCDIEPVYVDEMIGDARHTLSSIEKAKKLIGYEPKTTLAEGLEKFIVWYRANQDFYTQ